MLPKMRPKQPEVLHGLTETANDIRSIFLTITVLPAQGGMSALVLPYLRGFSSQRNCPLLSSNIDKDAKPRQIEEENRLMQRISLLGW
jgi:hypothetical protein